MSTVDPNETDRPRELGTERLEIGGLRGHTGGQLESEGLIDRR